MLTCFPTPYPDEWWYSVLCRYHTRSGNTKQQTTIRELFHGSISAAIGAVYPNNTICRIAAQLPSWIFDTESIILQNTLFPYFTRCCLLEQKREKLNRLILGETAVVTSIRRLQNLAQWVPRYCSQCAIEDRSTYGEAYWHITHQIPLLTLCPIHGYRLQTAPSIDPTRLNDTFYPLDHLISVVSDREGVEKVKSWREPLDKILSDYQSFPIECGATLGYNNLAITLSNMGYGVIQKHGSHTILNGKKLYRDLLDFFGVELVRQVFGGEALICNINRLCKWEMVTPERYALLQCFAGLPSETMFSGEQVADCMEQKLQSLSQSEVRRAKKQVAEELSVTQAQLDILVQRYNIHPFWRAEDWDGAKEKQRKISVVFNEEEFLTFKQALKESGFRYDSHFAKHCILSCIGK